MDALELTDDEVVAVAVDDGHYWPVDLRTVATSAESLREASFRGHRSLAVRGLLRPDGRLDVAAAAVCAGVVGTEAFVTVYLAGADMRAAGWGTVSAHYPGDRDWVLDVTTPIGVHRISRQPVEDHRSYLEAMLSGAEQAGPEGQGGGPERPQWLCAVAVAPVGAQLAVARRGVIHAGPATLADDGALRPGALEAISASHAATLLIDWVTAAAVPASGPVR